jgi:hypothetical protein
MKIDPEFKNFELIKNATYLCTNLINSIQKLGDRFWRLDQQTEQFRNGRKVVTNNTMARHKLSRIQRR